MTYSKRSYKPRSTQSKKHGGRNGGHRATKYVARHEKGTSMKKGDFIPFSHASSGCLVVIIGAISFVLMIVFMV